MSEASERSKAKLKKLIDDDEQVKEYIRAEDALRVYSIGRRKLRQIAIEAGAYYKVGKMILIRIDRFEEYLEKHKIVRYGGDICNAADRSRIAASRGNIPLRDKLRY